MSRIRTDLKPAAKTLKSPNVNSTNTLSVKGEGATKFPPVSPRCMSASPGSSIGMKWTVDMVRGYAVHGSERSKIAGNTELRNADSLQTSRAHEKLNQKFMSLQKLVTQLRDEIKMKNKKIVDLQGDLKDKQDEYNQSLEKQKEKIIQNESKIDNLYREVLELREIIKKRTKESGEMKQELAENKMKHDERLENILKENDAKLLGLNQLHKNELADRDSKISVLKRQLESALNNNSKERQRQLDELTKELTRVTDETDLLKTKLRAFSKQKQSEQCHNCVALEESLQDKLKKLREKDDLITELLQHGQKMAKQLSRTDEFLKLCERANVSI